MDEQPLISVLVPVYNKAEYLEQTVESILAQDYGNFEVVLVDDGSTDGGGTLCDDFAARHENVRVVHQANAGVAAARNTALAHARGAFISWVDADEVVMPVFLSRLYALCVAFGTDVAMCRVAPAGPEGLPATPANRVEPDCRMGFEEYCGHIYTQGPGF